MALRSAPPGDALPPSLPPSLQQVQEEQLSSVVDWLTAQPRAAQLLDKDSSVVSTLEHQLGRYLKDVKRHYVKADKRSPPQLCLDSHHTDGSQCHNKA